MDWKSLQRTVFVGFCKDLQFVVMKQVKLFSSLIWHAQCLPFRQVSHYAFSNLIHHLSNLILKPSNFVKDSGRINFDSFYLMR
jgi:hypothetical protein